MGERGRPIAAGTARSSRTATQVDGKVVQVGGQVSTPMDTLPQEAYSPTPSNKKRWHAGCNSKEKREPDQCTHQEGERREGLLPCKAGGGRP